MNDLDRLTRITRYMVTAIGLLAIVGLFIPDPPAKKIPNPVVESMFYDSSKSTYEHFDLGLEPVVDSPKNVYYPETYGDESYVDFDMFNDEDEILSYYEED